MFSQNNKRAVESFMVAKAGSTFFNTPGTTLYDSNLNLNLPLNSIGVYDVHPQAGATYWKTVDLGDPSSAVSFVQNINQVGLGYPLYNRPVTISSLINFNNRVVVTSQDYVAPTSTVVHLSGVTGLASNNYELRITFKGSFFDRTFSSLSSHQSYHEVTTPDFSLDPSITDTKSYLLNKLGALVNLNSIVGKGNDLVVALGIDSTATSGTAISALTPSSVIVYTTSTGIYKVTLNETQIKSIQDALLASGLPATSTIVPFSTMNAGTATGTKVTDIFFLSLDRLKAWGDYVPNMTTDIEIYLDSFEASAKATKLVQATEGQGVGRQFHIMYRFTENQRLYNQLHKEDCDDKIEFPNPVDPHGKYNTIVIEYVDLTQPSIAQVVESPKRLYILIPFETTAGPLTAMYDDLKTFLNKYLSAFHQHTITI